MNTNRYSRHILLHEIGITGQQKLAQAKVLVVGAGGLSCPVLQYLAAAGIGTLGIIDFDVVEESNLQRQVLFGTSFLGKNKALAAKERLTDLNQEITINAYPEKLTVKNALVLFSEYDIVVDGTDNFATRYLVNDACVITDKPLVYGAIFKFEGQVSVFNYQNGPSYRCLFPEPPKAGSVPSCSEVGVLGVLPGIIGSMQANEVLKMVLGTGEVQSGKLLMYDSLKANFSTFKIKRVQAQVEKALALKDGFEAMDYDFFCGIETVNEISAVDAVAKQNVRFIDVRELHEQPKIPSLNPMLVPLAELNQRLNEMDNNRDLVVFCQTGIRSKTAVGILKQNGFKNSYSLKGGAVALLSLNKEIKI